MIIKSFPPRVRLTVTLLVKIKKEKLQIKLENESKIFTMKNKLMVRVTVIQKCVYTRILLNQEFDNLGKKNPELLTCSVVKFRFAFKNL